MFLGAEIRENGNMSLCLLNSKNALLPGISQTLTIPALPSLNQRDRLPVAAHTSLSERQHSICFITRSIVK
jgi:hypothetical protein